jgi:hypothetical protein
MECPAMVKRGLGTKAVKIANEIKNEAIATLYILYTPIPISLLTYC